MSMEDNFEEGAERVVPEKGEVFQLDIAGYEGPIDVLLQLARDQKSRSRQYFDLGVGGSIPCLRSRGP